MSSNIMNDPLHQQFGCLLLLCLAVSCVSLTVTHEEILFFFFNDTATTEIYTLPYTTLFRPPHRASRRRDARARGARPPRRCGARPLRARSEEHTSELQSHLNLVCRLLLEKKKKKLMNTFFYKKKNIKLES